MLYREIPKTGDKLSILGFGLMRLPQKKGTPGDGPIDEKKAARLVLTALDRGVNYLDTALPYHRGHSEPFLGKILTGRRRQTTRIATKLTPWFVHRPADMERILHRQLSTLGTDRIDYYLLHALAARNWGKMLKMGILEFLDKAKKQGKIVNAGFSFHGDGETFKRIVDDYDWTFCQIQYNFLDQLNQAGTRGLMYAAEKNLGVIVMEPLRGGNLAGRIPREVANLWQRAEKKRTPVEWALRWIWNHPQVTVALSGMNAEAQVAENIRSRRRGFSRFPHSRGAGPGGSGGKNLPGPHEGRMHGVPVLHALPPRGGHPGLLRDLQPVSHVQGCSARQALLPGPAFRGIRHPARPRGFVHPMQTVRGPLPPGPAHFRSAQGGGRRLFRQGHEIVRPLIERVFPGPALF